MDHQAAEDRGQTKPRPHLLQAILPSWYDKRCIPERSRHRSESEMQISPVRQKTPIIDLFKGGYAVEISSSSPFCLAIRGYPRPRGQQFRFLRPARDRQRSIRGPTQAFGKEWSPETRQLQPARAPLDRLNYSHQRDISVR